MVHDSQKDHSVGFGGKYGVQKDRKDSCAEDYGYSGKTEKHSSATDFSKGFGGKFGVDKDRQAEFKLVYPVPRKLVKNRHFGQKSKFGNLK